MLSIADETRLFITDALAGDTALMSLSIAGATPDILAVHVCPGEPARKLGRTRFGGPVPFRREILTELVVRMQRRRWLRFDDFVLGISPPDPDEWQVVHALTGARPECGPGWHDLLIAAAHWIIETGGDPASGQIKEKFSTLRWYHDGLVGDLGDEIAEAAEHLSGHICDRCGAPGRGSNLQGWARTRCEEHDHD